MATRPATAPDAALSIDALPAHGFTGDQDNTAAAVAASGY
jgi:hypothetical protein